MIYRIYIYLKNKKSHKEPLASLVFVAFTKHHVKHHMKWTCFPPKCDLAKLTRLCKQCNYSQRRLQDKCILCKDGLHRGCIQLLLVYSGAQNAVRKPIAVNRLHVYPSSTLLLFQQVASFCVWRTWWWLFRFCRLSLTSLAAITVVCNPSNRAC